MKKFMFLGLALAASLSVKADVYAYLTTALPVGSDFTFTVPAGGYTVYWGDDTQEAANVISTGAPVTGKLTGKRVKITAPAIGALTCSGQQLTKLVLPYGLKSLDCSDNQLTELSLQGQEQLISLNCADNQLTGIDYLGTNSQLQELIASNNRFTYITLPYNSQLVTLWLDGNQLTSLSLSSATRLQSLVCNDNALPRITMPTDGLTELVDFWVPENKLRSLTLTSTALQLFNVENNELATLKMAIPTEPAVAAFVGGNALTFANMPLENIMVTKLYHGNQADIAVERTAYAIGETITLPAMTKSDFNDKSLSTTYTWYTEDGAVVEKGSKSSDKDYYAVLRHPEQVVFLKPQAKKVYCEVTCEQFPEMKLRTPLIKVLEDLSGVQASQASKLTVRRDGSYLLISADQPTETVITDAGGALRWKGMVQGQQRIQMGRGIFVVNGHKFAF